MRGDSRAGTTQITPQLPADIEALHALVASVRADRDAAIAERDQARSQIDRLRHLLRPPRRETFPRRTRLRAALCRAACRHARYLLAMRPDQK